jgi:hypothetical protein
VSGPSKVAICIPAGDTVSTEFASDLTSLIGYQGVRHAAGSQLQVFFSKGGQPAIQRCDLVRMALQAGVDWILWLAPDMRFPRGALERLLTLEAPIVGANYLATAPPYLPVAVKALDPEARLLTGPGSNGLEAVEATGMGLLLTRAEIFRKLPEPWFMVGFNASNGTYFGEEIYFCRRAVEAGYRIVIDQALSRLVGRVGSFEYRPENIGRRRKAGRDAPSAISSQTPAADPESTVISNKNVN